MSKMFARLKDRISHIDRDDALKWGFLLGSGILGLVASVFDQRVKDKAYKREVHSEVQKTIRQITEEG